jgi:DNA-binding transcriptional LysR family regulator
MTVPSPSTSKPALEGSVLGVRLDTLQSFLVVAHERNLSRAAERLYLTQSGVTRRIRALERALGCRLLVTTTRVVKLTPEGRALVPVAEQLVTTGVQLQAQLASCRRLSAVEP